MIYELNNSKLSYKQTYLIPGSFSHEPQQACKTQSDWIKVILNSKADIGILPGIKYKNVPIPPRTKINSY